MKDVNKTEHEDPDHVESEGDEEHEEVPVVPPPDAVVDPGAVMVKYLDAVITHTAVATSRGSVELTGHTPFHSDLTTQRLYSSPNGIVNIGFTVIPLISTFL